ncbi:hypothetical protein MCUN1_001950 [Malassezia cuniculi]|uniref:Bromo domain-containing protein n=1 Tax=Malassezia cuniculi TaxID=948313 RepID=A0AAF0JBA5_9BASI|nr:hypothetical protein MCUN1_001950 [Malassezia cuniculi]
MDQRLQLADQLLLAQAVHHIGTSPPEWNKVSELILDHPLIKSEAREKLFAEQNTSASELFSASACEANWSALMRTRGVVDAARVPRTDRQSQLALARLLYADRIVEIQAQIHQREQRFRAIVSQLEDLKAGKLDTQLIADAAKEGITVEQQAPEADVSMTEAEAEAEPGTQTEAGAEAQTQAEPDAQVTDGDQTHTAADVPAQATGDSEKQSASNTQEPATGDAQEQTATPADAHADEPEEQVVLESQEVVEQKEEQDDGAPETEQGEVEAIVDAVIEVEAEAKKEADEAAEAAEAEAAAAAAAAANAAATAADADVNADAGVDAAADTTTEVAEKATDSPASNSSEDEDLQVEQDLLGDSADSQNTPDEHANNTAERHSASTTYGRTRRRSERVREEDESRTRRRRTSPSPEHDAVNDAEREKARRRTVQLLLMLLEQVESHTHSSVFEQPIKEAVCIMISLTQDAPGYYSLVREPIDMRQIKQRIKEGAIVTTLELRHALALMFANALMYNRPGTAVHQMAVEMRESTEAVR